MKKSIKGIKKMYYVLDSVYFFLRNSRINEEKKGKFTIIQLYHVSNTMVRLSL